MPPDPPPRRSTGDRLPFPPRRESTPGRGESTPGWRVTPAPDGRGAPPQQTQPPTGPRPSRRWRIVAFIVGLLVLNYWLSSLALGPKPRLQIPYSGGPGPTFKQQVKENNVSEVTFTGTAVQGDFKNAVKPQDGGKENTRFETRVPETDLGTNDLQNLLEKHDVEVNAKNPDTGPSFLQSLIFGFGPTILLVGLFIWFARRAASAQGGGIMSFGRSRARRADENQQRVTFADVAGIDEAEEELSEIVDFLRNPDKYLRLGGKIPKGVLLSGQPGTGKTLLARAVAGEAGVPFFTMSASEFVEMIVGVGASRVRDLFAQAKQAAPAIIFIDELDAIGRARAGGAAGFGGNDEREQTLNQILTEMDGFDATTGVIVIGATNRPEVLDQALLRPGRFDRRVTVAPPDQVGRRKILEVHTRSVPLDPGVDLDSIASSTPGMVGADLANLINEAALLAAKREHEMVNQADFADALEKVILGAERKVVMSEEDRRRTAYHESGHAIVGMLTPGADPVRKVSIIPRGMALGVTLSSPAADRFNYDEHFLRGKIKVALGGRVAEELVFGDITTGAESDIQQLTQIARQMVGRWGMSPAIGPVTVVPSPQNGPLLPGASETSEHTQRLVDEEVRRIVDELHAEVIDLLRSNRDKLDSLAQALLQRETLDEPDAYAAAGLPGVRPAEPAAT